MPCGVGPDAEQADPGGGGQGKPLSPANRRRCIERVRQPFRISARRAGRVRGQHRSTQRHVPRGRDDEERLVTDMIEPAWQVWPLRLPSDRCPAVERQLVAGERRARRASLAAQKGSRSRRSNRRSGGCGSTTAGACVCGQRIRGHVLSYDFVRYRSDGGLAFRILNILDAFTRECLVVRIKSKLASWELLKGLSDVYLLRGVAHFIRSDNGQEFVAGYVRPWIATIGAKTTYIEPGSPWENGYVKSYNARFRDELLNREIFTSLHEAQILIEAWRRHYHTARPHSALG